MGTGLVAQLVLMATAQVPAAPAAFDVAVLLRPAGFEVLARGQARPDSAVTASVVASLRLSSNVSKLLVEPAPERPDLAPAPLFGWIESGRGAYLADFEIGCGQRVFRRVSPRGGRRDAVRPNGRRHEGVDISIRDGDYICHGGGDHASVIYVGFAAESARVAERPCRPAAGNCVLLEREVNGEMIESVFAHLDEVAVEPGQVVRPGQVIGVVGKTGRATAPHLHYERRVNGRSSRLPAIERASF